MKKAHFLGLGLLGLALVGPAQATPIVTDTVNARTSGATLAKNRDSVSFVHQLPDQDLTGVIVEKAEIRLSFSGGGRNWTNGLFDVRIGDRLAREKENFAEFITIQLNPEWLETLRNESSLSVSIEKTNSAGSATFTGSELKLWGSGITPSAANTAEATADATPVPAPGTLFLLAAGLLAAIALLRRRLR